MAKKLSKRSVKNSLTNECLWGIPIFGRNMTGLLNLLDNNHFEKPVWIATINPEFVMNALKDPVFFNLLKNGTSVNVMDGVGLAWAREVLKRPRLLRLAYGLAVGFKILGGVYRASLITGVELIDQLCSKAAQTNRSVYFFGGWGDRSERTAKHFKNKFPGLRVAGARAENFDFKVKVDYLFVARGMKKQEMWISENLGRIEAGVVVGVGRSFDYYSGDLKRAPRWIRSMGFEWLYSLIKEPSRWRRQLELPKFIWKVLTS